MTVRAYLRYSPRTFYDKAVVDRYPPGAFAAFSAVLCLAEEQPERGRFRSERLLRLHLDEPMDGIRIGWGKWVAYLLEHGDLERRPDGSLYVAGWDEWQEGDVTVAERMARLRAKRSNAADRNADTVLVTPTVTVPAVTVPYSGSGSGSNSGSGGNTARESVHDKPDDDETALCLLAEQLSGTPYGLQLHSAMGQKAKAMLAKHGPAAVEAEWRRIAAEERGMPTVRQLVLGADNALNRVSSIAPPSPADRKADTEDFVARMNREAAEGKGGLRVS